MLALLLVLALKPGPSSQNTICTTRLLSFLPNSLRMTLHLTSRIGDLRALLDVGGMVSRGRHTGANFVKDAFPSSLEDTQDPRGSFHTRPDFQKFASLLMPRKTLSLGIFFAF